MLVPKLIPVKQSRLSVFHNQLPLGSLGELGFRAVVLDGNKKLLQCRICWCYKNIYLTWLCLSLTLPYFMTWSTLTTAKPLWHWFIWRSVNWVAYAWSWWSGDYQALVIVCSEFTQHGFICIWTTWLASVLFLMDVLKGVLEEKNLFACVY